MIKINFALKNHYEVCWALVFAKRLSIKLSEEISKFLLTADDSVTCILTMLLYSKNLLQGNLRFRNYRKFLNSDELYGTNWLFAYEAVRQGWLKPYNNPKYVEEDPFFKMLLENQVSFLRKDIEIEEITDLLEKETIVSNDDSSDGKGNTEPNSGSAKESCEAADTVVTFGDSLDTSAEGADNYREQTLDKSESLTEIYDTQDKVILKQKLEEFVKDSIYENDDWLLDFLSLEKGKEPRKFFWNFYE